MIRKSIPALLIFFGIVLILSVTSCSNPAKKAEREEEALINRYLTDNPNLDFVKETSGLYFLEVQPGQGNIAVTHDTAYVKYTGKFLDGTVFDTNVGDADTLIFLVNEGYLIPGFDEGITYMKQGAKAMFLVPSYLAYGSSGYYMPAYTPVLFDVELVKLKAGIRK